MRILITGATGLIGSEITRLCHEKGININYLTTSKGKIQKLENYKGFYWNPSTGEIDAECLKGVGAIIHLAGASVFQPWTKKNRKKIINSRIESAELLYRCLKENPHEVGQVVNASAIGIYPHSYNKLWDEEEQRVANNFLGEVVRQWESAADKFTDLGLRVAKIRIGLVLSNEGGALPQMQKPVKMNLGAPIGSGRQWQSWVHIYDVAKVFICAVSEGLHGVYNAVAPNPVTNGQLMQKVAESMNKKIYLPKVPPLVLKLAMGEMSHMVLDSQLVSSEKIQKTGFNFHYVNLDHALQDLENKKTGA